MKHSLQSLLVASLLGGASLVHGATTQLALTTPRIISLQTSLSPTGGVVQMEVQVRYDLAGKAVCTATVDGASAACTANVASRVSEPKYTFTLKQTTVPATVISIKGVTSNSTATVSYTGPKGRTNAAAAPVTIQKTQPVPATLVMNPQIDARNTVSGTGFINADYGTNSPLAGKLSGKVTTNSLVLALKQGTRSFSFNGKRAGSAYIGKMTATIPPGTATITNFSLAVEDFPVASGVAFFRGLVSIATNTMPQPVSGVTVTFRSDANGDGKFAGTEVVSGVTDAQGRYQIKANVVRQRMVTLDLRKAGFAQVSSAYPSVSPGAVIVRNAALQSLDDLSVNAGTATSSDGRIQIDNLPPQIKSIEARVFNPNTESAQFPGEFADNQSNLLVSTVFSAIEARDAAGKPVTTLGTNSMLCMLVARDCWPTLGDLNAGNGQIDVPMYFYDEKAGQWKRNSTDGWLEDSARMKIPEASLAAIRNGTFSGNVYAVGPITHLSYWNIDWPIETHACIKGVIVDNTGARVNGATVSVKGLTYTGSSSPKVTGEDGVFCSDIMRSEVGGEDVDRDGVPGETQQVQVVVRVGTNSYAFGPFNSPQMAGSGATDCLNVGPLTISDANRLMLARCTVTGRVVYSGTSMGSPPSLNAGDPIPNATVIGFDPDAFEELGDCFGTNDCLIGTTDSNGQFTLTATFLSSLTVYASASTSEGGAFRVFNGVASFSGCPNGPVTVAADHFSLEFFVGTMDDSGGNTVGSVTIINGQASVAFTAGTSFYSGSASDTVAKPTQLGSWLTLDLSKVSTGGVVPRAGNVTFTVTGLSPIAGTWRATGTGLNVTGTWMDSLP